MAIVIKSREQIERMRRAGRLVCEALKRCREATKPGVTTGQLDALAEQIIAENPGSVGLFKWYPTYKKNEGFPAVTCISVNDEVVHGIPGDRALHEGDLVSVDFGIRIDGWCGDSATTIPVGRVSPDRVKLCEVTEHVLRIAIENVRPGKRWGQIARQMQNYAERAGMGVIKDFVGHGIGQAMHEDPKVPNFASRDGAGDFEIKPGMVLAIEPMCTLGTDRVKVLGDGWTVVTADGKAAAHYEHTVAVTDTGCEVLTDGN
jgi:methionyl aminopeptidase